MAQILKFEKGGSTTPKWGTFTIDNVTYEMTDDNIASLYNHAKQLDNDVQYQFGFIINALKSGQNLTYANNVLSGNIDWDASEGQKNKIHKRPGRGMGKGRDVRLAISSLDELKLTNPAPQVKTLKFQDRYVEYEKGDDGKFVLTDGKKNYIHGAKNQEIVDFLISIKDYSTSDDPFKIEGLDKDESWVRNWYNEYSDEFVDILGRIQTGDSTAADKEILNDFLIYLDGEPRSSSRSTGGSGNGGGSNPRSGGMSFGARPSGVAGVEGGQNTSSLNINDEQFLYWLNSFGKGVWLNDNFVKAYPGMKSLLEGYENGIFYIDGKFYDANDPQLLENDTFKRFVEDNKRNPESNNIIIQTFTNPREGWRQLRRFGNHEYYSKFDNKVVKDITGQYILRPFEVENGITVTPRYLFQVFPENVTNDMYDKFGQIKPEYISYEIIDDKGNWVTYDNYSWSDYISQLNQSNNTQRDKYYQKVPNYLYKFASNGNDRLIDLGNGMFWSESKNRYIVIERTNTGQRALLLKPGFKPGQGVHPLHKINGIYDQIETTEDGKYKSVDLSSFGITLKHGGIIPKASTGLKFPNPKFEPLNGMAFDWAKEDFDWKIHLLRNVPSIYDNTEFSITPKGLEDKNFSIAGVDRNGKITRYAPYWYISMINSDGRYDSLLQNNSPYLNQTTSTTENPEESENPEDTKPDNHGVTNNGKFSINPSEVSGMVRLITNLRSSDKSRQITEKYADLAKRNILAMQAPQKTTPQYVEPAENRLIDKQIADTLHKEYAYSDPVLREQMRDKDLATVHYLETQKSANSSQAFNQHLAAIRQINDENAASRINLHNNVLQALNGIDQMQMNSELASNNTATTSWSNYLLELQDKFSKFEDQYKEALVAQNNLDTIREYENSLETAFDAAGGASKLSGESRALYDAYGFRPAMLREIDPSSYEHLTRKFNLQTAIDRVNYGRSGLLSIYPELKKPIGAKHGAKLSKLTTQFAINQGKKNVDINKLNKEIMKIFLKLIK